jgi:nucleotide-binding universal stress UspA family protein
MAIESILLAVGPSDKNRLEELAETAIDIAGPTGAEVTIAHVFTEDQYDDVIERLEFASAGDADPDDVADRHTNVRDIAAMLDSADVPHSTRGAVGEHGDEIVSLAETTGADLVIVGGRKRSPTGKAVFGSVAQEVMLNAPCPVTFVRGEE